MTGGEQGWDRRRWVAQLATLLVAATGLGEPRSRPATAEPDARRFVEEAFRMRALAIERGDQPYGAVVVRDGRVVGEGPSQVVLRRDPTAHAEMEAIRDAARRLGSADLGGATLFATSRPCAMCAAAAYWARLACVYAGAEGADLGPPRYPSC